MAKWFPKSVTTKKTTLRLALFFILLIFIPGCFLAYISLLTTSKQREMTVSRLLASERLWAGSISEQFEKEVLQCVQTRFEHIESCFHRFASWKTCIAQLSFGNVFVLDAKNQIVWPMTSPNSHPSCSGDYRTLLQQAERAEFAESEPRLALELYDQLYRLARNEFEKAKALNAMARIFAKLYDTQNAVSFYKRLVTEYSGIVDDTGIPFADYAGHQLLKLANVNNNPISDDLLTILELYKNGAIPLNISTFLLLSEIEKWNQTTKNESITLLINLVGSRLQFLSAYRGKLTALANDTTGLIRLDEYQVLPLSNSKDSLIFFYKNIESLNVIAGGAISIQPIITHLNQLVLSENQFKLSIKVADQPPQINDKMLSVTHSLSPLVPQFSIFISPESPDVIEQFIIKKRIISFSLILLFISGMVFGFVLVLRDVAREKQITQTKMDFISSVTHELKTPLTSIRLLAETIRLQRVKDKQSKNEYLSTIGHEAERLSRLINNVLDFSSIEKGSRHYTYQSVNLSQLVFSALATMEFTLKENEFTLTNNIESNVTATVDADAIEQALLNLLSNSIKYSQKTKEIAVTLWRDNEFAHLAIQDKGVGIPMSEHEKIFEKFYRSKHNKVSGAGLGLTVVRHIVDAHRGKIELESESNQGSKFTLIIPLERNSHETEKYSRN